MKFSILQQDLLPSLQTAARCVSVHASLPVLENILLEISGRNLKIAATNLEIGVIKLINAEALEDGQITVPAKTLLELITSLKQIKIEFESDGSILAVKAGKLKASINGIGANEFPVIPLGEDKAGIGFDKQILISCSQILFAAAMDEGRPILTGILMNATAGKIDFVATDGFRLAHCQVNLPDSMELKVVVPKRTFEEVLRVISEEVAAEKINISTSPQQNQVVFKVGQTIISSRLIEGSFPAWEKFVPQKFSTRVLVDKEELAKALKLASVFAKTESNIVILKTAENKITLESSAKEMGSQQNEVEGNIEGEELEIAFNPKFLSDAVSSVPSTQLMIEFSGPLSPALIKPVGVEGLEYIVMPVRIS